jgi:oligopeptide/dipeptide ABC transporter ATP-binding protein
MFLGRVCEIGPVEELFRHPRHPYTRFLLDSVPRPDPTLRDKEKTVLTGEIPSPVDPPSGCRFRTRCPYAQEICAQKVPEMETVGERQVACHFPL